MKRIGLTGNIGSGKTYVADILRNLGVEVFDADFEARKLYFQEDVIHEIVAVFGDKILSTSGSINKGALSDIVFKNKSLLDSLNQIIHPKVREMFFQRDHKGDSVGYKVYESALIFETGFYKNLDASILVVADEKLRISRVMERDKMNAQKIHDRVRNQITDSEKMKLADFIIDNNGNQLILPQILKIHEKIPGLVV